MIRVYRTNLGFTFEREGRFFAASAGFGIDALFTADDPEKFATRELEKGTPGSAPDPAALASPIASQEIWAAGVTYLRSKSARMAESKDSGGGSFYDRVYDADRPELFFKSTAHRVAAPNAAVRIRSDSRWNVPEPELTLAVDARGRIFGYTLGNDMSSRDIEGENPLYLPQAKIYHRSAAIGPCLVVSTELPPPTTAITLDIRRGGKTVFAGETTVGNIKRPLPSLAEWLYREDRFPHGCYLMTGTGIIPPDSFTLERGDEIRISAEPVGTLMNTVEV